MCLAETRFFYGKNMKEQIITIGDIESTPSRRPGVSPRVIDALGRDPSMKLFYAVMRLEKEQSAGIIDIGSGYRGDIKEMPHLEEVIDRAHEESKRDGHYTEYPSSYGTSELRTATSGRFRRLGDVKIDPGPEVMITRGITDSYDRVLRSLDITHIIAPSWHHYFVVPVAQINGMKVVFVPLDKETGNLDLVTLEQRLLSEGVEAGKALMYIAQPSTPLGTLMQDEFIEEQLIPYLKGKGIWLFSDSHIERTRFDGQEIIRPILSYRGAKDVAVEAYNVAKEYGLPGARAGGLVGNTDIINAVRLLATGMPDFVSADSQILAAYALDVLDVSIVGENIKKELLEEIMPRFKRMGWKVIMPKAGFDMVVEVPPGFIQEGVDNPSLLAAFSILRRFGVGFCPCSPLSEDGKYYLRIILKQEKGKIPRALDKLLEEGFDWTTDSPSEEDLRYLEQLQSQLDLTKL